MIVRLRRLRPARPVCALDVEATGTEPAGDRIFEVGVVGIEPDGHARVLSQLIDPATPFRRRQPRSMG